MQSALHNLQASADKERLVVFKDHILNTGYFTVTGNILYRLNVDLRRVSSFPICYNPPGLLPDCPLLHQPAFQGTFLRQPLILSVFFFLCFAGFYEFCR